jgi:DNA-directed RNA polymerase subunit RPC12/RpoP
MNLKFTQAEFDKLRKFQDRMAKEFGDTAYVGTNSATVLVEYSPQLVEMLRPMAKVNQFDYELLQLSCQDCGKKRMYLAVPGETVYVCEECGVKRKKSGAQKS